MRIFVLILTLIGSIGSIALSARASELMEDFYYVAPPSADEAHTTVGDVDIVTGRPNITDIVISIGDPSDNGMAWAPRADTQSWRTDNFTGSVNHDGLSSTVVVDVMGERYEFFWGTSEFDAQGRHGASLELISNDTVFKLTTPNGTDVRFDTSLSGTLAFEADAMIVSATYPNGYQLDWAYTSRTLCETGTGPGCSDQVDVHRISSVTSNYGYMIKYTYQTDLADYDTLDEGHLQYDEVGLFNLAYDYCDPDALSCSFTAAQPHVSLAWSTQRVDVTDLNGGVHRYNYNVNGQIQSIRLPGASSFIVSYTYNGSGKVATITRGSGTWTYTYIDDVEVMDPSGNMERFRLSEGRIRWHYHPDGTKTQYIYDSITKLLTYVKYPEGNGVTYDYDDRANVIQTETLSKDSGGPKITSTAVYPTECLHDRRICNKPSYTIDASGGRTDYTYDTATGLVLTALGPTVSSGRPNTTYTYTTTNARYYNSSGQMAAGGTITKLRRQNTCATASSCSGSPDEQIIRYFFEDPGVANNIRVTKVENKAGDGSIIANTKMTYDAVGNLLILDGPLNGTVDRTHFEYDALRRQTSAVGPDPDGSGPQARPAQLTTYANEGWISQVDIGTSTNPSASGLSVLQSQTLVRDTLGRVTAVQTKGSDHVLFQVTETTYDNEGRVSCQAVRLSLTTTGNACTGYTGGLFGPDRVTRYTYDINDRVERTTLGLGVTEHRYDFAYNPNGTIASFSDARGEETLYTYNAFDQRSVVEYPDGQTETYTYSTVDLRLTSYQNRDGQNFTFGYDAIGRVTSLDAPGTVLDEARTYDLAGRMTSVTRDGSTESFGFDALGRQTSATGPLGTVSCQHDVAGRRTQMMWPDGVHG